LDAFRGRGQNDFRASRDLEDIVTIVDGRPELVDEVHSTSAELQTYLRDEFRRLLSNRDFLESLPDICCLTPPVNSDSDSYYNGCNN
jgi:hypothetical protein